MSSEKKTFKNLCAALVAAVLAGIVLIPASTAFGVQQIEVPDTMEYQASDPVTVVEITKLSAAAEHKPVVGAVLQIVVADTGEVIYEWTTDGSTITINRTLYKANGERVNLNLETVYILREKSAPEGYEKAPDVRFEITGIYDSDVTIYDDGDGHAYLTGAHAITLLDDSTTQPREEFINDYVQMPSQTTVTAQSATSQSTSKPETNTTQATAETKPATTASTLSQTGDRVPWAMGFCAFAGIVVLAVGLRRRRSE